MSKFTKKPLEKIIYQTAVEPAFLKHKSPRGPLKLSEGSGNYLSMSTMIHLSIRKHSTTM